MTENEILQQTFFKVCTALLEQGTPSQTTHSEDGMCYTVCLYRQNLSGKELKCAIGHLLSNDQIEKYSIVEGRQASQFTNELVAELIPGVHTNLALKFLSALQVMHDSLPPFVEGERFVKLLLKESKEVSDRFGLKRFE
jgi:hypothetical protein